MSNRFDCFGNSSVKTLLTHTEKKTLITIKRFV